MYQKLTFIVVFVVLASVKMRPCQAQATPKIDSLRQQLVKSRSFDNLWALSYELFDIDNAEALQFGKEALAVAQKSNDSASIVRAGRITGQIMRRLDDLDGSIAMLSSVLPLAKAGKSERETMLILNALGIAHSLKAEYDKALDFNFQALVIRQKEGNKKQISISLNNIGWIYYTLESYDQALDYYLQSLEAKKEAGDSFDQDRLLINIGLCYNALKEYEKSEQYFNDAFKMCGNECDNEILIEGEYGLGNAFFMQGKLDDARDYYAKSLSLSEQEKNIRFEVENLLELGRIALMQDKLPETSDYLKKIEALTETQYRDNILQFYELQADYYTKTKNFETANEFRKKYSTLKDSIYANHVIKNLNRVQTQFAQRENLAIIAAKDEVLALNEAMIEQQRLFNWLLAAIVLLTSILGVNIYLNNKRIRTVNGALATAKQVIEDQNQLLDHQVKAKTRELIHTNEELVKVNDELDNFIYKTSHDIRGPLASLKGMVNLAIMDVKDEKALTYLGKLDLTAEKLNTVLTRLLIVNRINHAELKPEIIHFEPIIQEILRLEMKKGLPSKLKIEYDVQADLRLISDTEMVRLILENLIDNAIKFHNDSPRVDSYVNVHIQQQGDKVVASIIDNGTGIGEVHRDNLFQMFVRASERSETGGIGLYLAKLATEKLGGEISLVSSNEHETKFTVGFPDLVRVIANRNDEKKKLEEERSRMIG